MLGRTLRLVVAVALCLVLAASLPLAGAQRPGISARPVATPKAAQAGFWEFVKGAAYSLLNGCSLDPYGACLGATLPQPNNGCSIDPYGRCLPGAQLDNGCRIDPYGLCMPGS